MNAGGIPRIMELTDSMQILRFGPRLGYLTTFQPAGVRAIYRGESDDWVRLRLAPGYSGWVEKAKTRELPPGTPIPSGLISYIRTAARARWTDVILDLGSRLPFKVSADPKQRTLTLEIFGAMTNTDWVRYDPGDELIERIDWNQTDPGVYSLTVQLKQGPLWGYEAGYGDGRFVLSVRRPPDLHRGLRGLTICVDPGHALDPGAIGPTGMPEKAANLAIARALRHELASRGAKVVMTRTEDVQVDLHDRPAIARAAEADIFISVHNNAVPDGINPYHHFGTSSYYYHPFSRDLAAAIQNRLVKAADLPDFGLYHANFAVVRPTQYPAVLAECAFMIIPEHEEKLGQEKYQRRIAKGIARGVEDFITQARKEHTGR
jgi:N-acetylmuramoyl-L-alanine amidase